MVKSGFDLMGGRYFVNGVSLNVLMVKVVCTILSPHPRGSASGLGVWQKRLKSEQVNDKLCGIIGMAGGIVLS